MAGNNYETWNTSRMGGISQQEYSVISREMRELATQEAGRIRTGRTRKMFPLTPQMSQGLAFSGNWWETRKALGRHWFKCRLCFLLSVAWWSVYFRLPDPLFPHLKNGYSNSTSLIGLLQELNNKIYVKYLGI